MVYVDLHSHTRLSDGYFKPIEQVLCAKEKRLGIISITDHNTVDGLEEAIKAGRDNGIRVIPGVEIGVKYKGIELHLLGYGFDHKNQGLEDFLREIKLDRYKRGKLIFDNVNRILNVEQKQELERAFIERFGREENGEVDPKSLKGSLGRSNIALEMLEKGYVNSLLGAYLSYLHAREQYAKDVDIKDAIEAIHNAGGLTSLAHPGGIKFSIANMKLSPEQEEELFAELKAIGLDAIECYHPHHDYVNSNREFYLKMADKIGFLISGGSDWHGLFHPGYVDLGGLKLTEAKLTILNKLNDEPSDKQPVNKQLDDGQTPYF